MLGMAIRNWLVKLMRSVLLGMVRILAKTVRDGRFRRGPDEFCHETREDRPCCTLSRAYAPPTAVFEQDCAAQNGARENGAANGGPRPLCANYWPYAPPGGVSGCGAT